MFMKKGPVTSAEMLRCINTMENCKDIQLKTMNDDGSIFTQSVITPWIVWFTGPLHGEGRSNYRFEFELDLRDFKKNVDIFKLRDRLHEMIAIANSVSIP